MDKPNDRSEPCETYDEPRIYELGSALTFFLGDSGDTEDSAKVLPCTQCSS